MSDPILLIEAISTVARKWQNPDYAPRIEAEQLLFNTSSRATPEAVAFAINQQLPQLSVSNLTELAKHRWRFRSSKVGVVQHQGPPLGGLFEWLLVLLSGLEHKGLFGEEVDVLLKAFSDEVGSLYSNLRSSFEHIEKAGNDLGGMIALGIDEDTSKIVSDFRERIQSVPELTRSFQCSAALIDGKENNDEREDLAEDVLIHEGVGESSVRIIWAPEELNPDPYFESFAFFRGVYPAHERTSGSLQMKKAFLGAQGVPHAYGDGLEFLISKGEPECLEPCHIRWVTYNSVSEVYEWVAEHSSRIHFLIARKKIHNRVFNDVPLLTPGEVHRLNFLDYLDGPQIDEFLSLI